ncbi:hypothetical protein [Terrabacter sp. MAHUQ-38]|uniref:hypothetical protein n=1 Tax=unclassified Terrabacter TaxID=2630222 RepID=UPI001CAA6106|nr:hypothetical protein [Terrabacter sp. MAHUQ-38]
MTIGRERNNIPTVPADPISVEAMAQEHAMLATMRQCPCGATVMGGSSWGAYTEHASDCPHASAD